MSGQDWLEVVGDAPINLGNAVLRPGYIKISNLNDISAVYTAHVDCTGTQLKLSVKDDGHLSQHGLTAIMEEAPEHYMLKSDRFVGAVYIPDMNLWLDVSDNNVIGARNG